MAEKRMTQTQLVRKLAESCEVSNKVARQLLDTVAAEAIKEVKKSGVFVVPGLGRLVRSIARPVWGATQRPAKPSRFPPRKWSSLESPKRPKTPSCRRR